MRRKICGVIALAMLAFTQVAQGQFLRYEAETGIRTGTNVSSAACAIGVPCWSGTGFVTGFDSANGTDSVNLQIDVPDGLYELWVGYRSTFGQKGYTYQVDQQIGSGMFEQSNSFTADRAGLVNVTGGTNTLGITQNWGYYDIDYWELRPFTPPALSPVPNQLSNPEADRRTQQLMNYLVSQYGAKTLSGQHGQVGSNTAFPTQDYLNKSAGVVPAVRSSDFIEYSPSRIANGSNPNGESERMINWAKQTGGIPTMLWHWNAPTDLINTPGKEWWRGFYTDATTFDVQAALASPGSPKYNLLVSDIDAIAVQLQKFETAGVPVIWRPLHEAQGNMPDGAAWFWWGAKGPQAFKDLWRLMYDRLTNYHGLNNLIWEFTSSASQGNHLEWYPGDDYVDMIGLDVYTDPNANMSGQWYDILEYYDGRKMVALSETGTLPKASDLEQWGINWSYFAPWAWDYIRGQYVTSTDPIIRAQQEANLQTLLRTLLNDEDVITLNELPILPWKNSAPVLPGDYNHDNVVDAADYTLWRDSMGQVGSGLAADGNGNGQIDAGDYDVWKLYFGQTGAGSGTGSQVPEPASMLLISALLAVSCGRFRRTW